MGEIYIGPRVSPNIGPRIDSNLGQSPDTVAVQVVGMRDVKDSVNSAHKP